MTHEGVPPSSGSHDSGGGGSHEENAIIRGAKIGASAAIAAALITGLVSLLIWWLSSRTPDEEDVAPPPAPSSTYVQPSTPTPTPPVASQAPETQAPVSQAPVTQAPVTQAPPPQTTQAPARLPYKINPPREDPVKMCTAFSGTGSAPDGRYLWIVVQTPQNLFHFQDTISDGAGHWEAEKTTVGSTSLAEKNQKYRIIIVTVTPEVHTKINNRDYAEGVKPLPAGSREHTHITVTASGHKEDRKPCTW